MATEDDDVSSPVSPCPEACDVAIPIVYPNQPITIPISAVDDAVPFEIDVPASLRATFTDPDSDPPLSISRATATSVKVLGLGHAGIAMINGLTGEVRYAEYGRYDRAQYGQVRFVSAFNGLTIVFDESGNPNAASMTALSRLLTTTNGGPYAAEAVWIKLANGAYDVMKGFAETRMADVQGRRADAYDVAGNHCFTFAMEVAASAGANMNVSCAPDLELQLEGGNLVTRGLISAFSSTFDVPARQMRALQSRYRIYNVARNGSAASFTFPSGLNRR